MLEIGKKIALKRFQNGLFVVYFYPKDDTPGCTVEAQDFSKLLPEFQKLDVQVFGISKDDEASHTKFTEKCGLSVPLIADVDGEICNVFGAIGEKMNFGKKYVGIIRSTFVIKNGEIVKRWASVTVKGHAEKVLEWVKNYG